MKTKAFKFLTVLAILLVLVAMVACKNEVEPQKPEEAAIPSESEGASATNFETENDTKTIQSLFTDLATIISGFTSKDVSRDEEESKTTTVASGKLTFSAADNETALEVPAKDTIAAASILYTGFAGTATLTDNVLNATISYSATINEESTAYKIVITDFEMDDFDLYVGDSTTALDPKDADNADDYYYAEAIFVDCIAKLEAEFSDASVKVTDDGVVYDIAFDGGFNVVLDDLDFEAFLGDGDGHPFSTGTFNVDSLDLTIAVTIDDQVISGKVSLENFDITLAFSDKETVDGTTTTTVSTATIGFNYDKMAISASYGSIIVLNFESTDDKFAFDIVTTKVKDTADSSKNSSKTTFNVDLTSKVGLGLKVNDNSIGFVADLSMDVDDATFKTLDFEEDLVVTPKAATINNKYVNPNTFYTVTVQIVEAMSEDD